VLSDQSVSCFAVQQKIEQADQTIRSQPFDVVRLDFVELIHRKILLLKFTVGMAGPQFEIPRC